MENIPSELKELNQWVNCGVDPNNYKIPYNPKTLKRAKAGILSTWGTFEQALDRVETGKAKGIGFEFDNNGYYGIDLDGVFVDGVLTPEAEKIVNFMDSYTEISQSGTGIHIIIKADGIEFEKKRKGFVEIYDRKQYFIMTGDIYGELKPINYRPTQLKVIYEEYLQAPMIDPIQQETDTELLEIGLQKDKTLQDYWNGARPNGNESSDDLGLMNKLAFWTQGNEQAMQTAFLSSPHHAQKNPVHKAKCQREDYLQRTSSEAVSSLTAVATKPKSKNGVVYLESFHEAIRPLTDGDRLMMYDAIMDYGIYAVIPDGLPAHLKGYFALMKPNIDSSKNRYNAAVENGKKGGRPIKGKTE